MWVTALSFICVHHGRPLFLCVSSLWTELGTFQEQLGVVQDPQSLHGGCPVIKGNKWSSTKWMRVHEFQA